MKSSGIADTAFFGPELEFFVFDSARFDQNQYSGYYFLDIGGRRLEFGPRGMRRQPGNKIRYKEGYFPVPPQDTLQDLRTDMMLNLLGIGIDVEAQHHEVATGGQCEIDMKFSPLVEMADKVMKYKYIVKNTAKKAGKVVTFMPKPLFQDNGTGMHVHISLWKNNVNLFAGSGYAGLSDMALHAIGGLLKHAPSICAFSNPTTNSYKRLVPGYEAPVNLAYSRRNRSASIRIPMYSTNPKAKRVEFRCPDPSSNPYLVFSVMLMAVLDGIKNKYQPGRTARQGHLRPGARRAGQGPASAGLAGRRLEEPGKGPRIFAARRRVHEGCDRNLARLQAQEGSGRDSVAAASV